MAFEPENPHKWFTAGEAALIAEACRITSVPHTREGMTKLLKREAAEFPDDHAAMSRRRPGQRGGGGTEYYWSYFPEALWEQLDAVVERRQAAYSWNCRHHLPQDKASHKELTARRHRWSRKLAEAELAPLGSLSRWEMAHLVGIGSGLEWRGTPKNCPVTFTKPVIRTVGRCLIKYDGKSYFSADLDEWHGTDVVIYASDEFPDLIWCWDYDGLKHKNNKPHIGGLICTAKRDGNSAPYFPKEVIAAAAEKRAARRRLLSGERRAKAVRKE